MTKDRVPPPNRQFFPVSAFRFLSSGEEKPASASSDAASAFANSSSAFPASATEEEEWVTEEEFYASAENELLSVLQFSSSGLKSTFRLPEMGVRAVRKLKRDIQKLIADV